METLGLSLAEGKAVSFITSQACQRAIGIRESRFGPVSNACLRWR